MTSFTPNLKHLDRTSHAIVEDFHLGTSEKKTSIKMHLNQGDK